MLPKAETLDQPMGLLDVPLVRIENPTVRDLLQYGQHLGTVISVIEHPRESVTCTEKRAIFQAYPHLYRGYGDVRIARGALLVIDGGTGQAPLLHVGDSDEPIDFKSVRRLLQVPKKRDIRFYRGDVQASIGLPEGGVSPFVPPHARLDCVVFASSLFSAERPHQTLRWDFAFNRRQSVVIEPRVLLAYMKACGRFRTHLLFNGGEHAAGAVSAR